MTVKEKLCGVFPPVMTPFIQGKVDYDGLAFNIDKMNGAKLGGYMPLGTNGEFRGLTDEESLEVLRVVGKHKSADKALMAGTGRESAWATIEFTKRAAGVGVDFASVLTPHYYAKKMTDEALIKFYTEVADASPVPVLIYCAPGYASGVVISTAAVEALARHPNIVGMKDTSKEDITGYIKAAKVDPNFHVLAGSITKFLYGLQNGAIGGVLSIANYFPELCGELHSLFAAGKTAEAEELNRKLLALNDNTAAKSGVAGVKAAMNLLGYKGGEPRVPLLPLKDAELAELRKVLVAEGFIK